MTREERIIKMMKADCFKGWTKQDYIDVLEDWSDEDVSKGYAVFDFDGTGMLEINRIDAIMAFDSDEEAVEQAKRDGVKIIPIEELPENFDRKYLGWIDTSENRKKIKEYCERIK